MRIVLYLVCFVLSVLSGVSQNVGIGTINPHSSAELDVQSTQRGFLPPRMNFAQRNAIVNPAQGLMVYCSDCDSSGQPQFFDGSKWCSFSGRLASNPVPANLLSVNIGNQIWTKKNLDVTRYRNGDLIPQVTDSAQWANLTTGAWCWYNNDSATYGAIYGRLYNWYAVNDPRGLAPYGWKVPSEQDWSNLMLFLDPSADTLCPAWCYQSYFAGGALKDTVSTYWIPPNLGANNSTGFSAIQGESRRYNGTFGPIGCGGAFFWSSTESQYGARLRGLFTCNYTVYASSGLKLEGHSVRLIKSD